MFTPGQKIFALVFIVSFVIFISYQFYRDRKKNPKLFKGTYWVLIAVVSMMIGYVLLSKVV
jgi:cobalamin biosynthesis protein CobD/CbiB